MALGSMDLSFNSSIYMFALCDGVRPEPNIATIKNFLGTGFLINEDGYLATCGHVIDGQSAGTELFACPNNVGPILVTEVIRHPEMDFAICKLEMDLPSPFLRIVNGRIVTGVDVLGYGKVHEFLVGDKRLIKEFLFKGSVVRAFSEPELPQTNSVCELSFPVISGMSGGPMLVAGEAEPTVCGMLYGNKETSITTHKIEEVESNGNRYYERVDRIVEMGCAHTAQDVIAFLESMKIKFHLRQD